MWGSFFVPVFMVNHVRAWGHCEGWRQKSQKITGCGERAVHGSRPPIASKPGSSPPERINVHNNTSQPAGLTQLAPVPSYLVICLVFWKKRTWQSGSKHWKRLYRDKMHQTMVDLWHCRDWFVPEGMNQVLRRSEIGNHKRRTLNTRLSSVGTFACFAGPTEIAVRWSRYEKRIEQVLCTRSKKCPKIDPHISNPRSRWFRFQGVQVHP